MKNWKQALYQNYGTDWKKYFANGVHFDNATTNSSIDSVRKVYKRRALRLHPDKHPEANRALAQEAMQQLLRYYGMAQGKAEGAWKPRARSASRPVPPAQALGTKLYRVFRLAKKHPVYGMLFVTGLLAAGLKNIQVDDTHHVLEMSRPLFNIRVDARYFRAKLTMPGTGRIHSAVFNLRNGKVLEATPGFPAGALKVASDAFVAASR